MTLIMCRESRYANEHEMANGEKYNKPTLVYF